MALGVRWEHICCRPQQRWPRVAGKVVTIARPGELARLRGWSDELGGVEFRPLELPATAGDADDAGSDAEEASSDLSE